MGTQGLYGKEVDTSQWIEEDGMLFPPHIPTWRKIKVWAGDNRFLLKVAELYYRWKTRHV